MEQKLINLSIVSPSGYELEDITYNSKLEEYIKDGWRIDHFTTMPHYVNPREQGNTDMVLLTILLSR